MRLRVMLVGLIKAVAFLLKVVLDLQPSRTGRRNISPKRLDLGCNLAA